MNCQDFVYGDYRSPNGTNRLDDCPNKALWEVTYRDGTKKVVCGVHVRKYERLNDSLWRTDDALGRPRRDPWYPIRRLKE